MAISFEFGATAPPLRDQLRRHGYEFTDPVNEAFQADIDASTRLYVRGRMTRTEWDKVNRRVLKAIEAKMEECT